MSTLSANNISGPDHRRLAGRIEPERGGLAAAGGRSRYIVIASVGSSDARVRSWEKEEI
jgi:hypothetical protein